MGVGTIIIPTFQMGKLRHQQVDNWPEVAQLVSASTQICTQKIWLLYSST